tara:strand:- start:380 stop:562 length:183 start_codon:yes stop_codon:yes gene_type:complete
MMPVYFSVALGLGNLEIALITISSISFIVMFGIASAKGDYQGLIKSTLEQDKAQRNNIKK